MANGKSVREYLNGLVWDQKPRIERWLIDYAGAAAGKWIVETSELTPLRQEDLAAFKACLARRGKTG